MASGGACQGGSGVTHANCGDGIILSRSTESKNHVFWVLGNVSVCACIHKCTSVCAEI